jgi:cardiolipin synthase
MTEPGEPRTEAAAEGASADGALDRVATLPNAISLLRILLIPVFVVLLANPETQVAGMVLMAVLMATDWVDGQLARRLGQVSNVGKLLDPVADRLIMAAALVTLVVIDAFPLWAAAVVIGRDLLVLLVGGLYLLPRGVTIAVRPGGKAATFGLMCGIFAIAWGNLGLAWADFFRVAGWIVFACGLVLYLVTTVAYVQDARRALAARRV